MFTSLARVVRFYVKAVRHLPNSPFSILSSHTMAYASADNWLMFGRERLISIPAEYRPSEVHGDMVHHAVLATRDDNTLLMGHSSGLVSIIKLNLQRFL